MDNTEQATTNSGKAAPKAQSGALLPQPVVDSLAAASSVTAGGVVAWREVLSESYANFTSLDLVRDIKNKYRNNFGPEMTKRIEGGTISTEEAIERILKQNAEYNKAVAVRFEKAGFGSFSNRLKLLNGHEKWKIGLSALAVAGVALGSIMLVTRDMFSKKLPDERRVNDAVENQPSFAQNELDKKDDTISRER